GVAGRQPPRRQIRGVCHRPPRPRPRRAATGNRRGAAEARRPGPDAARGGACPEYRRGTVPVTDGARGRVWRQGRSIELLQLPRGDPGLFPAGPGAVRPRDAGGGATRRADLSDRCAPRGAQRGAPGDAGAGGEESRAALTVFALMLTAVPPFCLSAQVDRTKPPALPPPPALKLPAVRTTTLANGLTLAVVEMHKVPVVDVQLLVDAGAVRDPSAAPGLATFTATMLQQGAGARSALDVADEAAFLGAQLGTGANFDGASASIHVPKRRLARRRAPARGRAVRRLGAGRRAAVPEPSRPAGGGGPHGVSDRQTGGGTVGGPDWPCGSGAHDSRLVRARGLEYHRGRRLHLALESESAGDPWVHLRRLLAVRAAPAQRSIRGARFRGHGEDRQLAHRVPERAAPHPRRNGGTGRAREGEGVSDAWPT